MAEAVSALRTWKFYVQDPGLVLQLVRGAWSPQVIPSPRGAIGNLNDQIPGIHTPLVSRLKSVSRVIDTGFQGGCLRYSSLLWFYIDFSSGLSGGRIVPR